MISIDDTVTGATATRHRDRRNDATTCGYCGQRVPKGHWCEQKREALKERACAYEKCGATFKPSTPHKRYCSDAHRIAARDKREYANVLKRHGKTTGPKPGTKDEIATIAPLEHQWAKTAKKAEQYVPVMGEALYEATMRLMRKA